MIIKRRIKIGDSCWLASGSSRLSAVAINGNTVTVIYSDLDGAIQEHEFPDACLSNENSNTLDVDEWNERILAKDYE